MKDRIRHLMESQHMTQQTFADFLGMSPASLSSIFNGRTKPTLNTVEAIRSKFTKINLDWLVYGSGPMFKSETNSDNDESSATPPSSASEGMIDFDVQPAANRHDSARQSDPRFSKQAPSVSVYDGFKFIDKPARQITEIRIFFDDQTWETFVPKK